MDFRRVAVIIILFTVVFALFVLFIFLFKTTSLSTSLPIDSSIFADYGTLVGGIGAALFTLATILLIIQSLNQQSEQFTDQNTQQRIEQIESKFFRLLDLHRQNVNEMDSKGKSGKQVVIDIYDEFHDLYDSVSKWYTFDKSNGKEEREWRSKIAKISYLVMFYGIGNKTTDKLKLEIKNIVNNDEFYNKEFEPQFLNHMINSQVEKRADNERKLKQKRAYIQHDGHQSRLGHYYRHLFQTVNYINKQPVELMNYNEKYNYIKTLRAQLTTHEQALLFYNSLTNFGEAWELSQDVKSPNDCLITKYNMIKNVPPGFTGNLNPKDYYPNVFYEFDKIMTDERSKLVNEIYT